jgi:hypothetical protein
VRVFSAILNRLFGDNAGAKLNEAETNILANLGTQYYVNWCGQLSGSPATSIKNTINNAFVAYCALRESGMSPGKAWECLGVYGGDDGVDDGRVHDHLPRVAGVMGLTSKTVLRKREDGLVTFLGRHYINAWVGGGSIADVLRQLPKLTHSTAPANAKPDAVIAAKAISLLVTDPKTPLLSQWAKKHIARFDGQIDAAWLDWWVFAGPFPAPAYSDSEVHVAGQVGMSVRDLRKACSEISATGTLSKQLSVPAPIATPSAVMVTQGRGITIQPGDEEKVAKRIIATKSEQRARSRQNAKTKSSKAKIEASPNATKPKSNASTNRRRGKPPRGGHAV